MTKLRILVVEDDALIGMLLADMLEEMGYSVCEVVGTQNDAVASAARCKPDLMIVDAQLREGSGMAAVDDITRTGFVPHVFVSGDIAGVLAVKPSATVLAKPFSEAGLERAIQLARASGAPGTAAA